jgi:hypothetical protein
MKEIKLFKTFYDRLTTLIAKMLSVKMLVFAIASWLVYKGAIPPYMWLIATALAVGAREMEKVIASTKNLTNLSAGLPGS